MHSWEFDTAGDPKLEAMLLGAQRFADEVYHGAGGPNRKAVQTSPHWLVLAGNSGIGKTLLAKQLLKFWRARGGWRIIEGKAGDFRSLGESRFILWPKYLERRLGGQYGELDGIREIDFAIIDDLGRDIGPKAVAVEQADAVVSAREGKWTVITTNMSVKRLAEHYDTRIASRMLRYGSVVIDVETTDYNLRPRG